MQQIYRNTKRVPYSELPEPNKSVAEMATRLAFREIAEDVEEYIRLGARSFNRSRNAKVPGYGDILAVLDPDTLAIQARVSDTVTGASGLIEVSGSAAMDLLDRMILRSVQATVVPHTVTVEHRGDKFVATVSGEGRGTWTGLGTCPWHAVLRAELARGREERADSSRRLGRAMAMLRAALPLVGLTEEMYQEAQDSVRRETIALLVKHGVPVGGSSDAWSTDMSASAYAKAMIHELHIIAESRGLPCKCHILHALLDDPTRVDVGGGPITDANCGTFTGTDDEYAEAEQFFDDEGNFTPFQDDGSPDDDDEE